MSRRLSQGFTAVELLIAMIVGVLLLGSAYQLHINVLQQSSEAQRASQASNLAYDLLRQYQVRSGAVTKPCSLHNYVPTVPSYTGLAKLSALVKVTCPYTGNTNLSLVTSTITYLDTDGTMQQVTRAITSQTP